jgi:hypothetical protein
MRCNRKPKVLWCKYFHCTVIHRCYVTGSSQIGDVVGATCVDRDRFFTFRTIKQASSRFVVNFSLIAAHANRRPQTPWCHRPWIQAPLLTLKPLRSCSQAQTQVPKLLRGWFTSEFQQYCRAWAPDHGSRQLKDIFGIARTNLIAPLDTLGCEPASKLGMTSLLSAL